MGRRHSVALSGLPSRTDLYDSGQNIFYRAVKKSGVRYKGGIHTLRHSFATHLIESGVELPVVQRLMGHASLMTTALYLHVTECRLGEVHSPLDLIDTRRAGVHSALQLAYPAFGTGTYPPLWNPRQQSQKSCHPSSPRDLRVPRARPELSAPYRRRQTDVLSGVRKSRNSSDGLYRCRRRSAHDQANAIRFLMNTLLALISAALDSCVQTTLFGCARVILLSSSPLDPGSGGA